MPVDAWPTSTAVARGAERVGRVDERAELGLGAALGGQLDGVGLQPDPQAVQVVDLGGRQRAHHRARGCAR